MQIISLSSVSLLLSIVVGAVASPAQWPPETDSARLGLVEFISDSTSFPAAAIEVGTVETNSPRVEWNKNNNKLTSRDKTGALIKYKGVSEHLCYLHVPNGDIAEYDLGITTEVQQKEQYMQVRDEQEDQSREVLNKVCQ
ncbi:hypothetical protein AbraIFM66951_005636 [Aspergillus brasiliensis]|nr:hypothetical protein AbraIFM66951_005636 [Aspergillus brasiliensis]